MEVYCLSIVHPQPEFTMQEHIYSKLKYIICSDCLKSNTLKVPSRCNFYNNGICLWHSVFKGYHGFEFLKTIWIAF